MKRSHGRIYLGLGCALALQACASEEQEQEPFALRFAALVDDREVGCTDESQGFGPAQAERIGLNDLRIYVSNLHFKDADGRDVEFTLDTNEFQYASPEGSVALIDLTGNTEGSCGGSSIANAEGTARTHEAISGMTALQEVASVSFDVGVPQDVMRATIEANTPESAPSPLNEMYWNWNKGYRHFVLNFTVRDAMDAMGAGYVHVGSRDCAPAGDAKALSDRETCTFVNTPAVSFSSFDLTTDTVGIDLRAIVDGLDFVSPVYDPNTFEVIGEGPGVECHSSPMQPDCPSIFEKLGLDMASGAATASTNSVFVQM